MLLRLVGLLACQLVCAAPAFALELPGIEAGQWEFMTVKAGEQPLLHRECLAANYLSTTLATTPQTSDSCTDKGLRRQGKAYVRELRCTGTNGQSELRRSAWTAVSPIHLENRIERVAKGKTETLAQISLVRAGNCLAGQ
ncbi:MAG: DUF3617 family protein [Pseudomonadota bacterium]